MCFSATGSFVVSAALVGAGAVALTKARWPGARMLGVVPLMFAAQQCAEGVVWLTVGAARPGAGLGFGIAVFLGFALVVWPTWIPVALRQIERVPARRRRLGWLVGAGAGMSAAGLAVLVLRWPHAHVAGHSVHYDYGLPGWPWAHLGYLLAYLTPTVGPFFVSSLALGRALGALLLAGLVVAMLVREGAVASVWCFFAAVISVVLVLALDRTRRAPAGPQASTVARPRSATR